MTADLAAGQLGMLSCSKPYPDTVMPSLPILHTISYAGSAGRAQPEDLRHQFQGLLQLLHVRILYSGPFVVKLVSHADGLIEVDGRQLVELEDVTRRYKHPSIADIKVGLRTWYSGAEQSYIDRCKLKDAATTQAALGYKVCGMQVSFSVKSLLEGFFPMLQTS